MTTTDAYNQFIIKINANAITDGLSCDKGRFITLYNKNEVRLIELYLERKFEDDVRYIQKLLVDDVRLTPSSTHLDHTDFKLPQDFLDNSNLYCIVRKGECKNQKVDCFEIKNDDVNLILADQTLKPSFKYREAPYHLSSDKIKVYTQKEFDIEKAYFSYYRYPKPLSLVNPEDPESDFTSQNPELDDKFTSRVIDLCTSEFFLNSSDQRFQIEKQNAITKP